MDDTITMSPAVAIQVVLQVVEKPLLQKWRMSLMGRAKHFKKVNCVVRSISTPLTTLSWEIPMFLPGLPIWSTE